MSVKRKILCLVVLLLWLFSFKLVFACDIGYICRDNSEGSSTTGTSQYFQGGYETLQNGSGVGLEVYTGASRYCDHDCYYDDGTLKIANWYTVTGTDAGGGCPCGASDGGGCNTCNMCIPINCANTTYCGADYPAGCSYVCPCKECELCALKCGQAKQCGGNCPTDDTIAAAGETAVDPVGTETSPAVIVNNQTPTFSWTENTISHTDWYEIEVRNIGGSAAHGFIEGIGTTEATTGTLPFNVLYHWHVRGDNTTCVVGGSGLGPWSDDQYFYLAQAPFIKSIELDNITGVLNPDAQGRNHICQQSFYDTTTGENTRRLMIKLTMTEAHLVAPISAVYLRFENDNQDKLEVKVDNLDTANPTSSIVGLDS